MGQKQSIVSTVPQPQTVKIGRIKSLQFPLISTYLPKLLQPTNFKKTQVEQQCLFHYPYDLYHQNFKLMCKQSYRKFKQINGYGQLYNCQNGNRVFEGTFLNGWREGYGIEYDEFGGKLYEGEFKGGVYHGWGRMGGYEGEWKDGAANGWGVYHQGGKTKDKENNKFFYEGEWRNNKYHGFGLLNIKKLQVQKYMLDNAKISLQDYQQKYLGQWAHGYVDGMGKLIRKQQIYIGQFSHGKYNGDGLLILPDGRQKKGFFSSGEFLDYRKL